MVEQSFPYRVLWNDNDDGLSPLPSTSRISLSIIVIYKAIKDTWIPGRTRPNILCTLYCQILHLQSLPNTVDTKKRNTRDIPMSIEK